MLFHTFQCKKLILSLCVASLLCTQTITAFAQPTDTEASDTAAVDYDTDAAMRLEEPIDSNTIDGWPTGPVVGAEGERRPGGGGHAIQRFVLGERTLLCK